MTYIHGLSFQLTAFLEAVGAGFILGAVYSLLRMPGRVFGTAALTAAGDLVFCAFACFFTFCFILAFNDGQIRTYVFFGEFFGWLIFNFSAGFFFSRAQSALGAALDAHRQKKRQKIKTKKSAKAEKSDKSVTKSKSMKKNKKF